MTTTPPGTSWRRRRAGRSGRGTERSRKRKWIVRRRSSSICRSSASTSSTRTGSRDCRRSTTTSGECSAIRSGHLSPPPPCQDRSRTLEGGSVELLQLVSPSCSEAVLRSTSKAPARTCLRSSRAVSGSSISTGSTTRASSGSQEARYWKSLSTCTNSLDALPHPRWRSTTSEKPLSAATTPPQT